MEKVCERCSLKLTCAGSAHDPAECEYTEYLYIVEIDGKNQEEYIPSEVL